MINDRFNKKYYSIRDTQSLAIHKTILWESKALRDEYTNDEKKLQQRLAKTKKWMVGTHKNYTNSWIDTCDVGRKPLTF
jgi:aspartate/tyrosine/aromatic aminotransferase